MGISIGRTAAFAAAMSLALTPVSATEPYRPGAVIGALKKVSHRLKIVTSHRGAYTDWCPENTECAINRAAQNNIEAVEIDVKETKDGVLWPSHDITIGRGTNYTINGQLFDPFKRSAQNSANNPYISSMTSTEMFKLKLRDMSGRVTHVPATQLFDLLLNTRNNHPNILVILDIKYASSVQKAALAIKALHMQDQVVMKFSMDFFTPLEVTRHTLGYPFVPTLYSGSLDRIAETRHLNLRSYYDRVFSYVADFRTVPGFVYYELGNKMFFQEGSSVGVQGPMQNLTQRLRQVNAPIGNFNPVIEHHATAQHPFTGFYHTDGQCCTRLIDFLTVTKHFGRETRDDRPNLEWQLKYNDNVITDNAIDGRSLAHRLGFRQDEYTLVR